MLRECPLRVRDVAAARRSGKRRLWVSRALGPGRIEARACVFCFQPPILVVARCCGWPIELAKLVGCQISKRTVWPHLVILSSPALNDHACFGQGREEFAIQTLVAKLIVKALDISLFPGRARLDVQALNLSCAHPLLDRLSDELRAICHCGYVQADRSVRSLRPRL